MSGISSTGRQVCALICRQLVREKRRPIIFLSRSIIWPSLWVYIFYKFLEHGGKSKANVDSAKAGITTQNGATIQRENAAPIFPGAETFISILLLLTISLQLYYYVVFMVTDKSSGMKSLMISVGLRKLSYYLANFVCFMALVLPLVLIIAILSTIYLFDGTKTSTSIILTIFALFILHVSGLVFVFSSLFKIPSLCSLILITSVLEVFIHPQVREFAKYAPEPILFLASADPYESIKLLAESYKNCDNNGTTLADGSAICVSNNMLIIAMAFWTLVAYLFGIWFEKASPWQTDTANEGLCYCFRSSTHDNQDDELELSQRTKYSSYFERTESNRSVGISIKSVSREFSGKPVISNVSFDIYRGETTLLLGHNGAGKTTLMNIILGKLMPNKGYVSIDAANGKGTDNGIGVCPQTSVYDDFLSVRQHMKLFSDIKSDLTGEIQSRDIGKTMFDVSLDGKANSLPSELSGGMKRKLSLGMAFVGKSTILILDEPSSGLDPDSRVFVWNAIRRYRADRTVLLSTQHMEEADYLGDRIAIMSEGRIICCGSSVFLTRLFGSGYKLRVECYESKREMIVELAKKYFSKTKLSDNEHIIRALGSEERITDMVLELNNDDDTSKNLEDKLVNLLEEIESNLQQLGIRSHGLKSSSIEDVLLNTSDLVSDREPPSSSINLTMTSAKDHISTLIDTPTIYGSSGFSEQKSLLMALIRKHLDTYKSDWKTLLVFRGLIFGYVMWRFHADLDGEKFINDYKPTLITFGLISHYIHYPVRERASGFKSVQMTTSSNLIVYWLSQLMIDMITIIFTTLLVCIVTWNIYNLTGLLLTAMATLLFGIASALNCYVLSFLFKEIGSASTFLVAYFMLGNLITQAMLPLIGVIYGILERATDWSRNLQMVNVILFPTNAFRYILHGIIRNGHIVLGPNESPPVSLTTDMLPPMLTGFCSLLGQIVVFAILLFSIEYFGLELDTWVSSIWLRCKQICCSRKKSPARIDTNIAIDQDVMDESRKASIAIEHVPRDKYSLVAHDLSKTYIPTVKAVDQLSFTVNRGECFGLLGVNGAGKSTTFSMLVGEKKPDSGQIWINGLYLSNDRSSYMQKLGYDPQSNPTMSLSPMQALRLMARLRRVDEETIPALVNAVLEILDMSIHANKKCGELSGGTMRKLTLGMSLIGNPEFLALDEPTAGVDPMARRSIWQLLRQLRSRKNTSIVISSHAMEECEAICDRISIMARGRLRCIGTFLHLRSKFSQGCTVRIQFSPNQILNNFASNIVPDLANRLSSFVGKIVNVVDTNINSATYSIPTSEFKRSLLFSLMREFRNQYPSITYMVNDSSLEDIFIKMAQEQKEHDNKL